MPRFGAARFGCRSTRGRVDAGGRCRESVATSQRGLQDAGARPRSRGGFGGGGLAAGIVGPIGRRCGIRRPPLGWVASLLKAARSRSACKTPRLDRPAGHPLLARSARHRLPVRERRPRRRALVAVVCRFRHVARHWWAVAVEGANDPRARAAETSVRLQAPAGWVEPDHRPPLARDGRHCPRLLEGGSSPTPPASAERPSRH